MNEPISTGDPQAAEKLTARIAELEQLQARMKEANSIVRKYSKGNQAAGVVALTLAGFTEGQAIKLFQPDYAGRIGFAGYELTNNNANLRRLKERLTDIQKHANDETSEQEINGCTIIDNVEDNRVQIEFPGKPPVNVRDFLKMHGFKWAPSVGYWQRHRGAYALQLAKQAVGMLPDALTESFNRCCDSFRADIYRLASQSGKTWQEVYALWRQYSDAAERSDQSALIGEFERWYAKDLVPASVAEARAGLIPSEETDALPTRTIWDEGAEHCTEPMLICPPLSPRRELERKMEFHGVALSDGPEDSLPLGPDDR